MYYNYNLILASFFEQITDSLEFTVIGFCVR